MIAGEHAESGDHCCLGGGRRAKQATPVRNEQNGRVFFYVPEKHFQTNVFVTSDGSVAVWTIERAVHRELLGRFTPRRMAWWGQRRSGIGA